MNPPEAELATRENVTRVSAAARIVLRPLLRFMHEVLESLELVFGSMLPRHNLRQAIANRIHPLMAYQCSFCGLQLVPVLQTGMRRLMRLIGVRDYVCPHCFDERVQFDRSFFGLLKDVPELKHDQ